MYERTCEGRRTTHKDHVVRPSSASKATVTRDRYVRVHHAPRVNESATGEGGLHAQRAEYGSLRRFSSCVSPAQRPFNANWGRAGGFVTRHFGLPSADGALATPSRLVLLLKCLFCPAHCAIHASARHTRSRSACHVPTKMLPNVRSPCFDRCVQPVSLQRAF